MTATGSEPLLRLENVSKAFGGIAALDGVSLSVRPQRIVGVIGPNGAGKTTLFNVITGAYRADGGEIWFEGRSLAGWRPHRIVRAGIARTFQNIRLFATMTVWEHVLVAQPHEGKQIRRLLPARWADPAAWARAEDALVFLGLQDYRDRVARTLPYGLQRKVEIARALTARPKLLLLDEPVAGMNHGEASELRQLILDLQQRGLTILLIEHDMSFVMNLCNDLYVLDFGALIAQGGPEEIRTNPVVLDAYLGAED
jgi:branched-chain amino acid transport system ATP-binding protein